MSSSQCTEQARHELIGISSSVVLKSTLLVNLLFSAAGLVLFAWATWHLWHSRFTQKFHTNLRLVVQVHIVGFAVHCAGRVVLHTLDLFNYQLRDDVCDMIPNIYRCFVFRLMYNAGMWITMCTAIPLIVERFVATCRKTGYEKSSPCLGVFLCLLQPTIAAIPLAFAYSNLEFKNLEKTMTYCSVYKPGYPTVATCVAVASVVTQFLARLTFGWLFRKNSSLRQQKCGTLSTRYQLEENKNSMECLKVYANISTAFILLQHGAFALLIQKAGELRHETYLALMEIDCAYPLYGIISVAAVTWKIRRIRNKLNHGLSVQTKLPTNRTTDAYFEEFKRMLGDMPNENKMMMGE